MLTLFLALTEATKSDLDKRKKFRYHIIIELNLQKKRLVVDPTTVVGGHLIIPRHWR